MVVKSLKATQNNEEGVKNLSIRRATIAQPGGQNRELCKINGRSIHRVRPAVNSSHEEAMCDLAGIDAPDGNTDKTLHRMQSVWP